MLRAILTAIVAILDSRGLKPGRKEAQYRTKA